MQALWWEWITEKHDAVRCTLCFHRCRIHMGKSGFCNVRHCTEEGLESPTLGKFSSIAIDPIEKKPLYHWMPGTRIFSVGSIGCTMRCVFCQNHTIAHQTGTVSMHDIPPAMLVELCRKHATPSVAFTYNEPTLQAEYIMEAAPLLKKAGVSIVLVTNGMIGKDALDEILPHVDAANIDVKTFFAPNYASLGGSLKTVQHTVSRYVQAGKHVELTTLVVPGISDSLEHNKAMVDWIASLSPDIPLHFSRYFPAHTYTAPATNIPLLMALQAMAKAKLTHVHIGNVPALRA